MGFLVLSMLVLQAPPAAALVGLWDFAPIYGEAVGSADPVAVHQDPSAASAVVARLDATGITRVGAAAPSCRWVRDLDLPAAARGCIFTESAYEMPSLAVFDRRGRWLRIALDNKAVQYGWVQEPIGFIRSSSC